MRIGVYLRVSSETQRLDLQRDDLFAFVKARGWIVTEVYEEKLSATTDRRPEFQRLLSDARSRKIDVILCWKLDRFFRSLKDLVVTIQELEDLGVKFISYKDNLDLTTSQGRLLMHLLGAFAEFEASLIQQRVRAGLSAAKKRGTKLGRPRTIDRHLVVSLRKAGRTYRQISNQLGISTGSVADVLKAEKAT